MMSPSLPGRRQNMEVGPDGLWRVEEIMAASQALARAGDGMSAHNKGCVCPLDETPHGHIRRFSCMLPPGKM